MTHIAKPVGRLTPPPRGEAIDLPADAGEPMELVGVAEWTGAAAAPGDVLARPLRPLALVADDDAETRRLVREVLDGVGCDVVEAADGSAALELARTRRPDVAIVDAMMPAVHGFDVCRALKGDPAFASTRVLLCSGAYRDGAVEDARARFGADAALEKPFRLDELRRVVTALLFGAAAGAPERAIAERAWRAAAEALGRRDSATAARLAQDAVAADPACAEAHYWLGHALVRGGAAYQAVAAFEAACALRPDLALLHESLAELLEQLDFRRAARAAWMRAAEACADPGQRRGYEHRLVRLLEAR